MITRPQWCGVVAMLLAGSSIAAELSSPDYLRTVGPTPLRLQPPPMVLDVPPLPLPMPPAPVAAPTSNSVINPIETKVEEPPKPVPLVVPADPKLQTNTVTVVQPPLAISALGPILPTPSAAGSNANFAVTPQMLVEFFKQSSANSNRVETSVIVPVQAGFMPPTMIKPPSSTATYETPSSP